MRNICLEKPYKKCNKKSYRPFFKKSVPLVQKSQILHRLFLLHFQVEAYQMILKLRCRPLAFTLHQAFLKNKKRSRTSLLASIFVWFLKKIFFTLHSINWQNTIFWLLLLLDILSNMYFAIVYFLQSCS